MSRSAVIASIVIAFLLGVSPVAVAQDTHTWTGAGDGVSFSDGANWSPTGVPTAADDVMIDAVAASAYEVRISSARTVENLVVASAQASLIVDTSLTVGGGAVLRAGTIAGASTLTVQGLLTWRGGTMTGAGTTTSTGGIAITGDPAVDEHTKILDGRRLVLASGATATHTGARLYGANGGVLEVADAVDLLFDGTDFQVFRAPRVDTEHTHGTGCTFASALCAHLARGRDLNTSITYAKRYVTATIQNALALGNGHGPTNHFFHIDVDAAIPDVASVEAVDA